MLEPPRLLTVWSPPGAVPTSPAPAVDVVVVGGPDAGRRVPLLQGEHRVGSHRYSRVVIDDPALERIHLVVTVWASGGVVVRGLPGADCFVDGIRLTAPVLLAPGQVVTAGHSLLAFESRDSGPGCGLPAPCEAPDSVRLGPAPCLSWNPWTSHVRRGRFQQRVRELEQELVAFRSAEAAWRRAEAPDAPTLLARAGAPACAGRRHSGAAMLLRVGWADQPTGVPVDVAAGGDARLRAAALRALRAHDVLPAAPATVSLRNSGSLGIAGEPGRAEALLRWLLVQLAVLDHPDHVALAAALPGAGAPASWDWTRQLPHTHAPVPELSGPRVATEAGEAGALLLRLLALCDARRQAPGDSLPAVVAVLHEDAGAPAERIAQLLEEGPPVGVHPLWLGSAGVAARCGAFVEVCPGGRPSRLVLDQRRSPLTLGGADGVALELAREAARAVAGQAPAPPVYARAGMPPQLSELLQLDREPERGVLEHWTHDEARHGEPTLRAPLGMNPSGVPLELELHRHSAPALVHGGDRHTRAAFLQSVALGLAAQHAPGVLGLAVLDAEGGALDDLAALPHVPQPACGDLAAVLDAVEAELRRREESAYGGAPPGPGTVVVLAADLGGDRRAWRTVAALVQRGPAVGIHLVMDAEDGEPTPPGPRRCVRLPAAGTGLALMTDGSGPARLFQPLSPVGTDGVLDAIVALHRQLTRAAPPPRLAAAG